MHHIWTVLNFHLSMNKKMPPKNVFDLSNCEAIEEINVAKTMISVFGRVENVGIAYLLVINSTEEYPI